jgi:hypothetical protein
MKTFKFYNNLVGWVVFIVAAIVYILTAEPTASLWDCGEFIATAFKLEVGHPPGAPLFMMFARVFTLFAGSDVASAAKMVNYMSALASAFTILFLFWTITHIARKIVFKNNLNHVSDLVIVIGSGIVGALAYTFSDTFWFSAVEGEVYASSSFFTAIVFWAILKWEDVADEKYANRWIILIAYLMGLSLGVHLLNLLAIPAIVMVYYFKKYKVNWKGALIAFIISLVILAVVMYGIISGILVVASWFELGFVNNLGMPFNTGIVIYIIVLVGLLVYGLHYSIKKRKVLLNTILLCLTMIIIGYTSFAAIIIRANTDTPINENKPNNVFALLYYLNREQYGDRPLIYGQYFNAPMEDVQDGKPRFTPIDGKYEVTGYNYDITYDKRFTTFFPRMYSSDQSHISVYRNWANIKGKPVEVTENGKTKTLYVPTFGENLRFFLSYQVGHMYMRYFLWNFVGRQNDEQGNGILKGNWLSGINYIDSRLLGPQDKLPPSLKNVPSRNTYYFLPFLLGILGLMFLLDRSKRDFTTTTLLFIFTGLAIVVYLNQTPLQPRERDYAYAGSFYAFAIWIGLGVMAIYYWIKHEKTRMIRAIATVLICLLLVPCIMARENWDDHDRSGRYTARAYAYNYLNSCAPNAILFTYGDNDTFPLWYLQEVEGIRTDVRVVNTMLLNTDWYIEQMKKKAYNADPLPISMNYKQYIEGKRSRIYLIDKIKEGVDLKQAVAFVASDDPRTKTISGYNEEVEYIPGKHFTLPVDTAIIFSNGTVSRRNKMLVEDTVHINAKDNSLTKSQLLMLDIIANNNWKKPVYFVASYGEGTCWLDDYLQLEGFAYRLVPIKTANNSGTESGRIDTEKMYDNLMNKFDYGRIEKPDVYIDQFNQRTLSVIRFRNNFARLGIALAEEGKKDSAIKILDKCQELTPSNKLPDDIFTVFIANGYFIAGDTTKGLKVIEVYYNTCKAELDYFSSLRPGFRSHISYEIRYNMQAIAQMEQLLELYKQPIVNEMKAKLSEYQTAFAEEN